MDDTFKSLQLRAVVKDNRSERVAVDGSVWAEDVFAEHLYDIPPGRLSRPDDVPGKLIGIDDDCAAALEHLSDCAFARRDASGQSDHDHAAKNSMDAGASLT